MSHEAGLHKGNTEAIVDPMVAAAFLVWGHFHQYIPPFLKRWLFGFYVFLSIFPFLKHFPDYLLL